MKTKFCVKKKTLLLIAGIVWMIAGFNVARLGMALALVGVIFTRNHLCYSRL